MSPKKMKITTDKARPSVAATTAVAAEVATRNDAATATEPPVPQPQMDNTAAPGGRGQTPEGDVQEVEIDQNDDEVEEDEDDEITKLVRNLKMLNQYLKDILRLQNEKRVATQAGHCP